MNLFDKEEVRDFEDTKVVYFEKTLTDGIPYEVSFLAGSGLSRKKLRKLAQEAIETKQREIDEPV